MERGVALSRQYGVDRLLQPIFDFVPGLQSPPVAPKHITAPAVARPKKVVAPPMNAHAGGSNDLPEMKVSARLNGKQTKASIVAENKIIRAAAKAAKVAAAATASANKAATKKRKVSTVSVMSDEDVPVLDHNLLGNGGAGGGRDSDRSHFSPTPSEASSASETPSPLGSERRREERDMDEEENELDEDDEEFVLGNGPSVKKRKLNSHAASNHQYIIDDQQDQLEQEHHLQQQRHQQQYPASAHNQLGSGPLLYARMILDYFVSESTQVPSFLITPPADFDANVVIDDDGHTALHWACAMGRIRIVKLLLSAGADIFRANAIGQTALMRSVMFTNNYDLRKFPELFELLHRSTINIDRQDRTVFHYIVDIALQKGKTHAARYYLETALSRLVDYPQEVADILNFQDEEGETALTLAARARSKRIVKILLDNGADPKIINRDGKNAEDYILEDERFRQNDDKGFQSGLIAVGASTVGHPLNSGNAHHQQLHQISQYHQPPPPPTTSSSSVPASSYQQQQQQQSRRNTAPTTSAASSSSTLPLGSTTNASIIFAPQLHTSTSGQQASHTCIPRIATLLESLATSFDSELQTTTNNLQQAITMLGNLQAEILESQRTIVGLQQSATGLEKVIEREEELKVALRERMGKRFRLGWEKWVRDEETRQNEYVVSGATTTLLGQQSDLEGLIGLTHLSREEREVKLQTAVSKISALAAERVDAFEKLVELQGEAGTGGKMREYKTLIALGSGVPVAEIDGVLEELLESLENGA